MITGIAFFLYSMLLIWAVMSLVRQYKRNKIINASIFLQVAFILYYIFIPIITFLVIGLNSNELTGFLYKISITDNSDTIYALVYTFVAYSTIFVVCHIRITSPSPIIVPKNEDMNRHESNFSTTNRSSLKKIYRMSIIGGSITLFVGLIGVFIVANSLGGFFNAITMGDKLRAYGGDLSVYIPQNRLFTVMLMVSSLASTYLFVYALRIYKGLIAVLLLLVSITASVFYLMLNAGRLGIILFIFTFFADFAFRKLKHPFVNMLLFSILGLVLLDILDDVFFYLSYGYVKESSTGFLSIINDFAFPYLNLLNIHHINEEFGLRWGMDFVTWIINIIPSSILSIFGLTKVTSGYQFITEYYMGANATGGIPTDLLTLGLRQFGFLGIIIICVFILVLCKFVDRLLTKVHSKQFYFMTLRVALMMFIIVPYADFDSFVRNRYDMILILLFLMLIRKMKLKG